MLAASRAAVRMRSAVNRHSTLCLRSLSTGARERSPLQSVPRTTQPAEIRRLLEHDGGLVIEKFLSPSQVESINRDADPVMAQMQQGRHLAVDDEIKQFVGLNTKRLSSVVSQSRTWRDEVLDDDYLHDICDAVIGKRLGDYWMNSSLMIEIGPGEKAQALHRDAQQWWPFAFMGSGPGWPNFYLNFLVALTDTTAANGATRYVPGSHLDRKAYTPGDPDPLAYDDDDAVGAGSPETTLPVEMKAGDAMLLGDGLLHGGGANLTRDQHRRIVSLSFVSSAFTVENASPLFTDLSLVSKMPKRVQKLLGFRTMYPAGSPGLWGFETDDTGRALGLGPH